MGLLDKLKGFDEETNIKKLSEKFLDLSESFLYGGYIKVRNDFRVYIRTVEFYYHSEKKKGIHDPIVYHRNGRELEKIPYFPIMTLNAHNSGFDITFENASQEYRASALIRSYEVVTRDNKFLKATNGKFDESESYQFNNQSTYLYAILNGFCNNAEQDIIWIDEQLYKKSEIVAGLRQNVYKSKSEFKYERLINEKGKFIKCDRPWSFTRTDKIDLMIKDTDTNIVYISDKLKSDKKDFYNRFTQLLDEMDIDWKEIPGTNDIWARDYMPIQLGTNDFLAYNYNPDYLQGKDRKYITDSKPICEKLGIKCKDTDIKLDGGNITLCGKYIVLTNKVFSENGKDDNDAEFIELLKKELRHDIIIIPWHCIEDDKFGHSDGFIHWCGGNNVLMSNHRETDPDEAEKIKSIMESYGFKVTEMLFDAEKPNEDYNWAYINYLQVGKKIIVPAFGIDEDKQALEYIKEANPSCDIHHIRMRDIANHGGALHCITWNIKKVD